MDQNYFVACRKKTVETQGLRYYIDLFGRMARSLPAKEAMDRICQHCGESIVGNAYRVTSEENGITMLDMIVCSLCFMEAKRLRLHTEEINLTSKQASPRNRRSHVSRLGI
jgi:superfamily II helicase